ncbi:MAG: formate-dependent phosphoribosylglycinamide formyltransferase [Propionibacteriales bacterium]|nr:formate-dependent phosphoribosylglycinamide formyltransferase [Propionibacteriales bacterium]
MSAVTIGTPLSPHATRAMLLGSGELGKEVAIELQRLGVEVIAVDRYADAPAMQVAHRSQVVDMTDPEALRAVLQREQPQLIVPEVEAIATEVLSEFEGQARVVPTARATQLTMDREGIRRLAAEELGLPTSDYRFADSLEELRAGVTAVGMPCVVKPVMSSSGKGQSVIRTEADIEVAWAYARSGGRVDRARVIVEAFVPFDFEITLLTVRHAGGVTFCDPVGHLQIDGDYRESWQPAAMGADVLAQAQQVAEAITGALGGWGLFGVELFIVGDRVVFSEVSPRPHDTGMVTLVSQDLSEFALHARAILGLPVPQPLRLAGDGEAAASVAVVVDGTGVPVFSGVEAALSVPTSQLRLFGKPRVEGHRRVAVALARGADVDGARERARQVAAALTVTLA